MRNKICVFIITLLSLCSGLPAQTQPGKLSGVIIDTNDEEILPGANIYIEALKKGVSADKKRGVPHRSSCGTLFGHFFVYGISHPERGNNDSEYQR